MNCQSLRPCCWLMFLVAPVGLLHGADTREILDAPVAKSYIQIRLSGKDFQWHIPETKIGFQSLPANKLFVAPGAVTITYSQLNPLAYKVEASSKRRPDAQNVILGSLVTEILGVLSNVNSGAPGLSDAVKIADDAKREADQLRSLGLRDTGATAAHPCESVGDQLDKLRNDLTNKIFSPEVVGKDIKGWSESINASFGSGASGPEAVGKGITAVQDSANKWTPVVDDANKALQAISACADSALPARAPALQPLQPRRPTPEHPAARPTLGENPTQPEKDKYTADLTAWVNFIDWQKEDQSWTKYDNDIKTNTHVDTLAALKARCGDVLIGLPGRRVRELESVTKAAQSLITKLQDFATPARWEAPSGGKTSDFVLLRGETPTFDEMEDITVKVTPISYPVNEVTGIFSAAEGDAVSQTFGLQRYSKFVIEPGVGAVFSTVTQPKYGTATNSAGQTVVAKAGSSALSINPAVMVNFVCNCGTGRLVPMLQIGATASKALPSVLLGGGLRLFAGKFGGIGIAGGAAFAWVQDLKTLQVGQVVTGTAAIDADKGYSAQPKIGAYFTIQYQFKTSK